MGSNLTELELAVACLRAMKDLKAKLEADRHGVVPLEDLLSAINGSYVSVGCSCGLDVSFVVHLAPVTIGNQQ